MTHLSARSDAHLHDFSCHCDRCEPPVPSVPQDRLSPNAIAILMLAGIAVGLVLSKLLDLVVGGPGILAMFGL